MIKEDEIESRLAMEIESFQGVWGGGYFEGDVLDPIGYSTYGPIGYISILHALYLMAIRPYVTNKSRVLEIGPGRGAFSKAINSLDPKELWCIDAVAPEDNGFYNYVGRSINIKYLKVKDFSCSQLPDDHFDYLFSFGALCHVSFDGIKSYLTNLFPKLKSGAQCFIMIADYDKYNRCMDRIDDLTIYKYLPFKKLIRWNWKIYKKRFMKILTIRRVYPESLEPEPGRWYHAGVDETCKLLSSLGYTIVSNDIGIVQRDPIIHFKKN